MITEAQLEALTASEKAGMLHYLLGYLGDSPEFQKALGKAYEAQTCGGEVPA